MDLETILFYGMMFIFRLCPLAIGNWIGSGLGVLAFKLLKPRRELTIENIREARQRGFIDSAKDDYQLAKAVWQHLGLVGSEFIYYYNRPHHKVLQAIRCEGEDNLKRILAKQKGAIVLVSHLGNWELLGIYLGLMGYKPNPIVQTQANSVFDKIINDYRRSVGMKPILKLSFLRPVVEAFKRNELVSFMSDQNAGKLGIPLEVFGREAKLPRGAAEFALKTGTPVVFIQIIREARGRHRIEISEEIPLIKTGGDYQQDLQANTARFIGIIQEAVAKQPEQWLWMHKLWPTRIRA